MLRPYRGITPKVHLSAFVDQSAQVIGDVQQTTIPSRSFVMGRPAAERYVGYRREFM